MIDDKYIRFSVDPGYIRVYPEYIRPYYHQRNVKIAMKDNADKPDNRVSDGCSNPVAGLRCEYMTITFAADPLDPQTELYVFDLASPEDFDESGNYTGDNYVEGMWWVAEVPWELISERGFWFQVESMYVDQDGVQHRHMATMDPTERIQTRNPRNLIADLDQRTTPDLISEIIKRIDGIEDKLNEIGLYLNPSFDGHINIVDLQLRNDFDAHVITNNGRLDDIDTQIAELQELSKTHTTVHYGYDDPRTISDKSEWNNGDLYIQIVQE